MGQILKYNQEKFALLQYSLFSADMTAENTSKGGSMADRLFGEIEGINEGAEFETREALSKAGVHRPNQKGISGGADEGSDSIVLSGGYEDDEDFGTLIVLHRRGRS